MHFRCGMQALSRAFSVVISLLDTVWATDGAGSGGSNVGAFILHVLSLLHFARGDHPQYTHLLQVGEMYHRRLIVAACLYSASVGFVGSFTMHFNEVAALVMAFAQHTCMLSRCMLFTILLGGRRRHEKQQLP